MLRSKLLVVPFPARGGFLEVGRSQTDHFLSLSLSLSLSLVEFRFDAADNELPNTELEIRLCW